MSIKIVKNNQKMAVDRFLFPAGEIGIRLGCNNYAYLHEKAPYQTIVARLHDSSDLMELALATDALRRIDNIPIRLLMPYVPYARQDRRCVQGESFSLKVFANLINSLGFDELAVVDPHSDVCGAVFDRVNIIPQLAVISAYEEFNKRILRDTATTFVSPDAGANKKTAAIANYFGHGWFIRADKVRDLATGEIKETVVYCDDLKGRDVVIADDICDGGRTFIELAKVLRAKGANKVILYVTHGIFTKGTEILYKNGIDEIFTTDSYYDVWPAGCDPTHTLKIEGCS